MSLLQTFKNEVEAYLSDSRTPPTTFGKEAVGDPNFVFDLRDGRSPHIGTIDKVRAYMRESQAQAETAA